MEKSKVIQLILDGKVYVKINSVSRSGMSRKMSFYVAEGDRIINITEDIHNLKWYGKYKNRELTVGGCGMDMVFAALYYSMDYEIAKNWNQTYNML